MSTKLKDRIKLCLAIAVLVIIIMVILMIIVQYQVEGEQNMKFNLSRITIISTAEGEQNTETNEEETKWNLKISQNNDIYFFIDKNNEAETGIIDDVTIQNIQITKQPSKGKIVTYMPSSTDGRTFKNSKDEEVEDSLTYIGDTQSDTKKLTISNQGGMIVIRFSNTDIGDFISNEEEEIKHDGTLITKVGTTEEEIKFQVNFDLIIRIDDIKYKANITLNLPCENLCEEGTTTTDITDMSNIIFKRIR
jgi:hypothetical protein